jgi:Ribbon-helix-helix protein, copG family
MRTTVTLADDVAAAVERERRERGVGPSEAINDLIRKGLAVGDARRAFQQRTHRMEARIDVTDVAEALETLDGPAAP